MRKAHSVTILAREGTTRHPRLRTLETIQGLTKPQAMAAMRDHRREYSIFGRSVYAYVVR